MLLSSMLLFHASFFMLYLHVISAEPRYTRAKVQQSEGKPEIRWDKVKERKYFVKRKD
jgi:hypothetical protein